MSTPTDLPGPHGRRRVVVVDNDPVMRAGTAAILADVDSLELLAAIDHDSALEWTEQWLGVDVAVVDASDQRRARDQFPGVAVVRSIRRHGRGVTVVVLTGQYLHPGLRHRMWDAGADFFYPRDEGMTADELISVVLRPSAHRRLASVVGSLPSALGVTRATRVNELVDRLVGARLDTALEATSRKKSDPHGERSRWWNHVRQLVGGPDGLSPTKASGERAIHLDLPSIVQVRKFWAAMARAEPSNEPRATEDEQ